MEPTADDFCSRILALDKGLRFVCIADKEGKLVGKARRKGLRPLLDSNETKTMLLQSLIRMSTRETLEKKLGSTVYAFAMYENVKRVTIPLRNSSKISHIMLVSLDVDVDHEPIVLHKILPELNHFDLHKN
jgi:hypothetical protein